MADDSTYTTPQWFWDAIDTPSESGAVEVDEADINYLTWSQAGNPGLLLVHGHNACLLYTSPSPRDVEESRMPSSA